MKCVRYVICMYWIASYHQHPPSCSIVHHMCDRQAKANSRSTQTYRSEHKYAGGCICVHVQAKRSPSRPDAKSGASTSTGRSDAKEAKLDRPTGTCRHCLVITHP